MIGDVHGQYGSASGGVAPANEPRWLLGRTQRILLELSTVFYFFARNAAIPLVQQYVYHLVARKHNLTGLLATASGAGLHGESAVYERRVTHVTTTSAPTRVTEDVGHTMANEELGPERVRRAAEEAFLTDSPSEMGMLLEPMTSSTPDQQIDQLISAVSHESSLIVLYLTIAELLPAAVVVLFLGSWSDASGRRKFLMWLPCIGNALYAIGFLLPGYINGADIDQPATMALFVGASVLSGLSGSVPGFLSGNAGYISDTDSPRRRTLRLAIVEMSIGLTFGIASLINGYWIAAAEGAVIEAGSPHRPPPGFEQPLWFVAICSLVPFVMIFFLLREPAGELLLAGIGQGGDTLSASIGGGSTTEIDSISAEALTYFRFRNFRGIRRAFGLSTPAQRKLWAIVAAFQLYVFVQQGQERTLVLFLQNEPIRAGPTDIGLQLFVLYVLAGVGSWPGVPLLQRVVDDLAIAAIAVASKMVGSLLTAVATNGALVYVASVVQLFHLTPYAVARSLASQQMGEDEQGSVYALVHSLQSMVGFLGPVVHTALYTGTLNHMSGAVFIMSGLILIFPLLLLGCTRYMERKEEGYQNVDGSNAGNKPFSPSSLTPLSESARPNILWDVRM